MKNKKYILVTPARNEVNFIENTIKSVISQTFLPEKWVIVSDGSTDGTDEIVKKYTKKIAFIEFLRHNSTETRNFSSKVKAISAGLAKLDKVNYKYLGNLDADITLKDNYYEKIIEKFIEYPRLGLACGKIYDVIDGKVDEDFTYFDSVFGGALVFRRKCFEDVGGYLPLEMGGEDTVAAVMARMLRWKVKTFADMEVFHHRCTGTAQSNILVGRYRLGMQEYLYGSHPLFEIAKCVYRIKERPYVLGSLLRACGYVWALLRMERKYIPEEVVRYVQREQMMKLAGIFRRKPD